MKSKEPLIITLSETTLDILQGLFCFYQEYKDTLEWLSTPNVNLGGPSPLELINNGKELRVLKFVNEMLKDRLESELAWEN